MSPEWVDRNPISPVLYVVPEANFTNTLLDVMRMGPPISDTAAFALYSASTVVMHSFIKPTRGHDYLPDGTQTEVIDYYQESEWRYVPTDGRIPRDGPRGGQLLEDFKLLNHPITKQHAMLRFGPEDVQHIIVEDEEEIAPLAAFLCDNFSTSSDAVIRRLLTRLKSFQSLDNDH
jgi:Putative abortive phage resistance protein AbiGi, antitoxin